MHSLIICISYISSSFTSSPLSLLLGERLESFIEFGSCMCASLSFFIVVHVIRFIFLHHVSQPWLPCIRVCVCGYIVAALVISFCSVHVWLSHRNLFFIFIFCSRNLNVSVGASCVSERETRSVLVCSLIALPLSFFHSLQPKHTHAWQIHTHYTRTYTQTRCIGAHKPIRTQSPKKRRESMSVRKIKANMPVTHTFCSLLVTVLFASIKIVHGQNHRPQTVFAFLTFTLFLYMAIYPNEDIDEIVLDIFKPIKMKLW